MGLLGNLGLGSLFGAADKFVGGAIDNYYNKKNMDYQAKIQQMMYQHRYQWAVADMKKAGLNPILAATSGIAGSMPGVSSASSFGGDVSNAAVGVSNSAAANRAAKTGLEVGKSTIALNASTAAKYAADADAIRQGIEFNRVYFPYEQELKKQTVENAKKQGELLQKQADAQDFQYKFVLPAMVNLYTQQGIQASSSAALNNQNAALSAANTRMIDQQAQDYERYGINPHNVTGWAAPIARLGDRVKNFLKNRYYPDD